jgi:aspartate/methionine/tyrosine aminotransferase
MTTIEKTNPRIAARASQIQPFYAVEVYREAMLMAARGRTVLMCIGEPDFPTPERVVRAAHDAARRGETHYTMPLGLPELRRSIAASYRVDHGVDVDPARVIVTVGGSAALMLAFGAIAEAGDEILMADPTYPSNRALSHLSASAGLYTSRGRASAFSSPRASWSNTGSAHTWRDDRITIESDWHDDPE